MVNYTYLTAKTGEIVPAINGLALHSTIDPVREAQKLLTTIPEDTGFILFLGLGGGFAPSLALETGAQVLVIDYDIKELLAHKDYSALQILQDPSNEEIQNYILQNYKPALHGGIKVIPLRTRVEQDKELFETAADVIQQAIYSVSSDYSVQAHFGKRWFCNIIRNVALMETSKLNENTYRGFLKNIKEAAIVAAGPSLDIQISELAKFKESGGFIICSDTALGALLYNNIKPDTVVSIDCQYKSYYHFLGQKNVADIPFVLDIASPPTLSNLTSAPVFFASGHPLANYLCANGLDLPKLDTSGGNVTYACLSLAQSLGAENITIFGADFAYVRSQTYARGTYVIPYFEEKQNRFKTLEAQSSVFMYRSPFLEPSPGQLYRETAQLRFYRERMEALAGVKILPGSGAPVQIKNNQHAITRINTNEDKKFNIKFLKDYRNKIANLANNNDQDILTTLLPYAAFLKHRNPELKAKELLNETKICCIKEIDQLINSV